MKYLIEIEIPYPEDLEDLLSEIDMALCSAAGHQMPGDSALEGVEVLSVVPNQNNRVGASMKDKKTPVNYKKFYEDNRIALLQYQSLRANFKKMVDNVLGADYYNMANDVYDCDEQTCEDITRKANMSIWEKLTN